MRKLSRVDLLELLLIQSGQIRDLQNKLADAEHKLDERILIMEEAGSIANASLQLSGVFEATQRASQQYLESVKALEENSRIKSETMMSATVKKCEQLETDTKIKCAEMLAKAKAESELYWQDVERKLDEYYNVHKGLRELLAIIPKKEE